jgi:hypothetical protein
MHEPRCPECKNPRVEVDGMRAECKRCGWKYGILPKEEDKP